MIESPSADGDDFGIEAFCARCRVSICARAVAAAIVDAATRHAGGGAQYDDLTVMVIGA